MTTSADIIERDEIIEELWKIKDEFSSSSGKDISKIVERINKIAEEQGFSEEPINLREKVQTS